MKTNLQQCYVVVYSGTRITFVGTIFIVVSYFGPCLSKLYTLHTKPKHVIWLTLEQTMAELMALSWATRRVDTLTHIHIKIPFFSACPFK